MTPFVNYGWKELKKVMKKLGMTPQRYSNVWVGHPCKDGYCRRVTEHSSNMYPIIKNELYFPHRKQFSDWYNNGMKENPPVKLPDNYKKMFPDCKK